MRSDLQQLVESVEHARDNLLASVATLTETQGAFQPSPDQWSVAQILEHLYLAELGGITKMWAALNDFRAGKRWSEALPNRGKSIDAIVAATWKPREAAPPVATPHFGGPLTAWCAALRLLPALLRALADELEGQPLGEIVFPHFLCGPLDVHQRLEFLRFHIERHTAQVSRVRGSHGFPAGGIPT